MKLKMEILDKSGPSQIAEFEHAFYEAFHPYSNPGVRKLWVWDDEKRRLKTQIPYESQEIFFIRDELGKMSTAAAFCVNSELFQSAAYGFSRPDPKLNWCETLIIFCHGGPVKKLHFMELAKLRLKESGFDFTYATCNEINLRLHKRAGAEVLEKSETEGQIRYFIRYDFNRIFSIG